MSSVRKVAAEAGVSPSTVSRILNNDPDVEQSTRERVLEVANRLGYAPKIGRRVNTILGLALPSDPPRDLGSFDGALVAGASRGCRDEGFRLAIIDISTEKRPNEAYTHFFSRVGVRGILLRRLPHHEELLDALVREGFPHVLIADRSEKPGVAWIDTDSLEPSNAAVRHLIELGHRRIALGRYARGGTDTIDRLEGYRRAHAEAGLEIDERLIIKGGDGIDDGARAVDYAISLPAPPTAFYMTHSMSSLGALRRLLERGVRVPQDISIVGFDDLQSRVYTHPTMTVVRQDSYDMAYRAARWIARTLDQQKPEPLHESIPGIFEVNQTTTLAPDVPIRVLPDGRVEVRGD